MVENFALKWVLYLIAWLSFVLGVIGAFLPVLPTTPFFILSAYLFSKTSPKLYSWITGLPYFGSAIIEWERSGVIRPRAKALATIMIILTFSYSLFFTDLRVALKVMLVIIGSCSLTFILTRKSSPMECSDESSISIS